MDDADQSVRFDQARWVSLARRQWLVVALMVVLGGALGASWQLSAPERYQASAAVSLAREPGASQQSAARIAANELALLSSRTRLDTAAPAGANTSVQVTAVEGSDIATVRASADDPTAAQQAVSDVVDSYLAERTTAQQQLTEQARAVLVARLAELDAQIAAGPTDEDRRALLAERTDTRTKLTTLDQDAASATSAPYLISSTPATPRTGSPLTATLAGLLAGLIVGVLVALGLDARFARFRGRPGEVAPGLPVMSIRRLVPGWADLARSDRDTYQTLANQLIAGPEGPAARTAIVPMDGLTGAAQFTSHLAEVLGYCGAAPVVADLVSTRVPVGAQSRRVSLVALPAREQLARIRDEAERGGADVVILVEAGPVGSPSQITASRVTHHVVLLAPAGRYTLRVVRRTVADLARHGVVVLAIVCLPAGAGSSQSHRRGDRLSEEPADRESGLASGGDGHLGAGSQPQSTQDQSTQDQATQDQAPQVRFSTRANAEHLRGGGDGVDRLGARDGMPTGIIADKRPRTRSANGSPPTRILSSGVPAHGNGAHARAADPDVRG
ncbi:MAG: hypothetical protein ACK5MT_04555 [Actinomycetales bacterium]